MNDENRTPDQGENVTPHPETGGTAAQQPDAQQPVAPSTSAQDTEAQPTATYPAPSHFGYGGPQAAADAPPTTPQQPVAQQQADAQPTVPQHPAVPQAPAQQPAAQQPAAQHPTAQQPTAQQPTWGAQPPAPYGAPAPHYAGENPAGHNPAGQNPSVQGSAFGPAAQPSHPGYAGAAPAAPATTRKRSITVPVIAALAIGALLGGASGAGVTALSLRSAGTPVSASDAKPQTVTVNDTSKVNQVTAVAAKASPSVVTISVSSSNEAGTGSGVIISDDGYVLTNTHVVTLDGATASGTIQVTASDGTLYSASIVGTDPTDDLAVIKLKDAKNLTPIDYGDSDKINVGETVIAIGAPLGLSNTVTDGIVSAVNRSISIASSAAPDNSDSSSGSNGQGGSSPFDFWDNGSSGNSSASSSISVPVIQTDASINPGNSGGALLDENGKLIGINVAIASTGSGSGTSSQSGSIGVGFAIPVNVAERIAKEIIANGKATHGLLGASVADATADDSSTVGALIAESPVSNGAAAAAGLQKGDVVTKFDGKPITGATDLTAQVRALAGGDSAKLTYLRNGDAHEVTVKLGTYQS